MLEKVKTEGFDDGIIVTEDGHLAETTIASFALKNRRHLGDTTTI